MKADDELMQVLTEIRELVRAQGAAREKQAAAQILIAENSFRRLVRLHVMAGVIAFLVLLAALGAL